MNTFQQLQAQLQPLLGAVVEQADLLIFPTASPADLSLTDVLLRLRTSAGTFLFSGQSDEQTPAVETGEAMVARDPGAPITQRLREWAHEPLPDVVMYECFGSRDFAWLQQLVGTRVRRISAYEYATGALTGLRLELDHLTLHSVPGAWGNRILQVLPPAYFPAEVRERPLW